jgi:hypothetical protein
MDIMVSFNGFLYFKSSHRTSAVPGPFKLWSKHQCATFVTFPIVQIPWTRLLSIHLPSN